jgi:hypothetical protein
LGSLSIAIFISFRRQGSGAERTLAVPEFFLFKALRKDISLDFGSQKVYRFLVVGNSEFKESIGAIWMKEEDSP